MTTLSPVETLKAYAIQGGAMEQFVRHARGVLDAINEAGFLDALPALEEDQRRHNAGNILLDLLEEQLRGLERTIEGTPGTDLSIHLDVMARELEPAQARGRHG